ncbi:MAG TPA: type II CAAX endopeptidase family protein, partial [Actinomycetota bacterium]|nr:type II CAAX endopeptidase family protein [Actinomycetota bacterium]
LAAPQPLPAAVPSEVISAPTSDRGPVVWRWKHLWAFGFAAWGLPEMIQEVLPFTTSLSSIIDRSMLITIVGYLLGALVLHQLVRTYQGGNWTTLGLGPFDARELLTGAGFGVLLLGAFIPIGLLLNHGRLGLDPLVKLLVGGASGAGVILVGIVVVLGAPIIEEIYFRGLLYEKLRRRSAWLAIPVTALLFTLAHGALLIPAILLMGFGLGFLRRKKTLWFTMGAHAAWNFVIVVVAAVTLLGGPVVFASSGNSFEVSHPSTWESSDEAHQVFGPGVDLALGSARGSFAMFTHEPAQKTRARATLIALVEAINQTGLTEGMDQTEIMATDVDFAPISAEGFEMGYMAAGLDPQQPLFSTLVVVQRPGSNDALFAEFRCVRSACMDDVHDFEAMLASIKLGSN